MKSYKKYHKIMDTINLCSDDDEKICVSQFDLTRELNSDDDHGPSSSVGAKYDEPDDGVDFLSDDGSLSPAVVPIGKTVSSGIFSDDTSKPGDFKKITGKKAKKTVQKTVKNLKRTADKIQKEKERAANKAIRSNNKILKPGECMKYVKVEIGEKIMDKPFSNKISESLRGSNVNFTIETPVNGTDICVGWIRNSPEYSIGDDGKVSTSYVVKREPFLLVIFDMADIEELIKNNKLLNRMKFIKQASNSQITVILFGEESYFSTKKKRSKNSEILSQNVVDYNLAKLSFEESISCLKAENPDELASTILQFTKAVAEIPFKKNKTEVDEKARFYMRGDNRGCVQVDKNGIGLLQLWCKSLTKFPLASLETAQAICEKYPSPSSFVRFLENNSRDEAIKILSDIPVRRSAGPLASSRRIGPQLANKIYTFFTTENGEISVS